MRPAVFLDRDGVIIENREDHVKSWLEVRFLDRALQALKQLAASHFAVVMVTNQGAIGRGVLDHQAACQLNRQIVGEILGHGGRVDASYLCPHHPEAGCSCRKPAPGMLRRAARELGIDLSASWLVGDALTDMEAALAVNARPILVRTGRGVRQEALVREGTVLPLTAVEDLSAAVALILSSPEEKEQ